MSKTVKGVDAGKAAPALVKLVKGVVAEAQKHQYSVSRVYAAYNAAFGVDERPQTCSSCLRNRVKLLADWLKGCKGATSGDDYTLADGSTVTLTAEGRALRNGKGLAAGRYVVEGGAIVVVPGGKARYEAAAPTEVATKTEIVLKDGRKMVIAETGEVIVQEAPGAEWLVAAPGAYEAEGGERLTVGEDGKPVEDLT